MARSQKHYLQLEFSTGNFYEFSKRRKEDFEEYDNGWRLYYDEGISGELQSISIRENPFLERQEISIVVKDDDGAFCYIPVPLEDQKGNINTYAESLISFLDNLEKGEYYTFRGYNFKPDDSKYKRIGISIKDEDEEKVEKALTFSYYDRETGDLVEGDIPPIEWETRRGKNRPTPESLDEKNDALWEVLQDNVDRLGYKKNEDDDEPKKKTAQRRKKEVEEEEEEEPTPRTSRRSKTSSRRKKVEEEEEEEPTPRKRKTSSRRKRVEEEEEEEPTPRKRKTSSRRKKVEEEEDDEPAPRKRRTASRKKKTEEEDDEPAPRKRTSRRGATSKKKPQEAEEEDWEDDLPF